MPITPRSASPITRPLVNPGVDVRAEKQRERADADQAGDAVQRLHLDQQSEQAEREQQAADLGTRGEARQLLAERVLGLPRERRRGLRASSAASSVGATRSATPRTHGVSASSERIAPDFLYAGTSTVLSTIAAASIGSRWLRCAVDSNSARSAEMFLRRSWNRLGRADAGAGRHHDVPGRERDQRGRRVRALEM